MRPFQLFTAALAITAASLLGGCSSGPKYAKTGYVVEEKEGRLWVFAEGSKELAEYQSTGDMAKRITRIGAGPEGKTIIGPDAETIDGYLGK
ncbi:MAG: hypothetical protein WD768_09670 [Phycisphaeraceae bacterium]